MLKRLLLKIFFNIDPHDYVFTTGGIGTRDDITAQSVSKVTGLLIDDQTILA